PVPTDQSADQGVTGPDSPFPAHDPALLDALAQLDPAYRLPILLHYYADLPLEQVAQSLSLSVPAIKSRLHRARALLRNSLAEAAAAGAQSTPSRARACASSCRLTSTATSREPNRRHRERYVTTWSPARTAAVSTSRRCRYPFA